jgi:hypothetical protein
MKGKFGVAALILSSITFADPVSTPNQLSDTPIISGGGSGGGTGNLSINNCRAYQNSTAINLSGGEVLVFYGGGTWVGPPYFIFKAGGYLITKPTYSGTAYVKWANDGSAVGLFARNTTDKQDFIAGAGGGYGRYRSGNYGDKCTCDEAFGGGWYGEPARCRRPEFDFADFPGAGGNVYEGTWFSATYYSVYCYTSSAYYVYNYSSAGFHGSDSGGGASSISAWYGYYTKGYTSPTTSATIMGGGIVGRGLLYVCSSS